MASSSPARAAGPSRPLVLVRGAAPARRRTLRAPPGAEDAAIVALALGHRTPRRARALLDASGGLAALGRVEDARLVRALGTDGARRLRAALELGQRAAIAAADERREELSSFAAVVAWARPRLTLLAHEEVWLLCLDGRNGLVAAHGVARGGLHGCALTARDVLGPALRDAASAIVLVHNHPSGDPTASAEDVAMTRQLALACRAVALPLLDHVVVARGGATSLLELGAI
ncbi:MAG: JAB domain-containing protein [Polyangiaceae bacterium]|nr:JAB domain-containing protein [Polyangiaceae bacterium]